MPKSKKRDHASDAGADQLFAPPTPWVAICTAHALHGQNTAKRRLQGKGGKAGNGRRRETVRPRPGTRERALRVSRTDVIQSPQCSAASQGVPRPSA